MAIPRPSFRRPSVPSQTVHAVGQRVFVSGSSEGCSEASLTDDAGATLAILADGTEVDIVAWRPRGADGTRYRIRSIDGVEGWLASRNLRKTRLPVKAVLGSVPAPGAQPAPAASRDPKRRFGA